MTLVCVIHSQCVAAELRAEKSRSSVALLDLAVSPNGRMVYAATSDGHVQQREAESGEVQCPALGRCLRRDACSR